MNARWGTVLVVVVVSGCGSGDAPEPPATEGVRLRDGIVVQPVTDDVAAGYVTITNDADQPDTLLEVITPIAGSAEVHASVEEDGMVHMRHHPNLVVPPLGDVDLAPGGFHLMLQALNAPIAAGDTVEMTFRFSGAGAVTAPFPVVRYQDLP
jgi:copper(I)-binding protein